MSKRTPLTFHMQKVGSGQEANEQTALRANEQTGKSTIVRTNPGREGRQFIAAHVLPDAAKQFKLLVVQNDTTTQDLLLEAFNDLFAKYDVSRIA